MFAQAIDDRHVNHSIEMLRCRIVSNSSMLSRRP
jgi:hypothetical protein